MKVVDNLEAESEDSYDVYAVYGNAGVIYIDSKLSEKNVPVLAHEMLHYFSDNHQKINGLKYVIEDQFIVGMGLTEGITNYLSTRVFPFEKGESVYEYETHVAHMLSILIGEEKLEKSYFSSNIDIIRNEMIELIKDSYDDVKIKCYDDVPETTFNCFDIFIASLDSHERYLGAAGEVDYAVEDGMKMADSVEETLLIAAKKAGKEQECKEAIKELIKNETAHIPWSRFSNFKKMIK